MSKPMCEGAAWCLLPPIEGSTACAMHTELPALKYFNEQGGLVSVEDAEDWKTRWRRLQKSKREAAKKQAESDAKVAERK